jgi:hypothetical protein
MLVHSNTGPLPEFQPNVFFPFVDRGIFAIGLGLGIAPAILLLVMLLTYSVTMSFVYHLLNRVSV